MHAPVLQLSTPSLYQSTLTPFNKNYCSAFCINDMQAMEQHLLMYNVSLCALYSIAHGVLQKKIIDRTLFQVSHMAPLQELFCYELRLPFAQRHLQALFMQEDLARRFPRYHACLATEYLPELHTTQPTTSQIHPPFVLIITQIAA